MIIKKNIKDLFGCLQTLNLDFVLQANEAVAQEYFKEGSDLPVTPKRYELVFVLHVSAVLGWKMP